MSSFALSPGVSIKETDLTSIIPAVAISNGAFAGTFPWGPVMDPTVISSENELVSIFGKPTNANATSFFTAANFLSYSNHLLLVRVAGAAMKNAVVTQTGGIDPDSLVITDSGQDYLVAPVVTVSAPNISGGTQAVITATVAAGFVTELTLVESGSGYTSAPTITITAAPADSGVDATATCDVETAGLKIRNKDVYETNFINGAGVVGEFAAKYPGSIGNSLIVSMADSATFATWDFKGEFDSAPDNTELHFIIIDADGSITGVQNGIIEKFAYLSKASDGRRADGTNIYYKFAINNTSKWVWWMDHPEGSNWGQPALNTTFTTLSAPYEVQLSGGVDDLAPTDGDIINGFRLFDDADRYDVSLVILGKANPTVAISVIDNVVDTRRDCVAFVSPQNVTTGEPIIGIGTNLAGDLVDYRDALPSTSYVVLDSGYKYQYDTYNDVYRWVPLNGDIAGLCARTDMTNDPWFSPGGYNRGQIRNVIKLAYNPNKTARDILYKSGINPVVSFPGQGTILYGDKTLLSRPSAFDRINVRRLFIVLEKAIATAAKYQLFEFNDEFTRAQFRSMVEPFLREVQGRRGILDFRVVADESNNTGEVIDGNRFVADIYIKPARAINFITLNFVAVRSAVEFSEVGG